MRHKYLLALLLLSLQAMASIEDYLPTDPGPSASNFGDTGLYEMPSARLMPEGSLKLGINSFYPYEVTSFTATPFSWMEAVFRYTEVKNQLYGPAYYSGNQTLKDKGFDVKFKLLSETNYLPSLAVGLRDLAGTGLFSSEYVVASKRFGDLDATLGIAWGSLARDGNISNPLKNIHDSFSNRNLQDRGSQGGSFNIKEWFSGEQAAIYGGLEYHLKRYGLRLKVEYDTSNHEIASLTNSGLVDLNVSSRFNYGVVYGLSRFGEISIGQMRGNEVQFSFHIKANFFDKGLVPKTERFQLKKYSKEERSEISKSKRAFYKNLTNELNEKNIYVQGVTATKDTVEVSINQNKYRSYSRATGRTARVVNSLALNRIETIVVAHMNPNNTEISRISIERHKFDKAIKGKSSPEELLLTADMSAPDTQHYKSAEFKPIVKLPDYMWKMGPALKSHIGGPEAFFLGQVWWKTDFTLLIRRGLTLSTSVGLDIYNNFNELNNPSASELPHVRSDIQDYLKEGETNIARLKLDYVWSPYKELYARIDIGLFEEMFGGIGGEILYKPFASDTAIGLVVHKVKQRDFDQRFSFRDYETTTGHFEFYHTFNKDIDMQILAGKYLAGDKGVTIDLARQFKSGFRLGIFATKTNVSEEEFGEGGFDKGFYFQIPTDLFLPNYQAGSISFGLHPLTKDGGAILYQTHALWGLLGNTDKTGILRDWSDILD